jgi:hypothetical protein
MPILSVRLPKELDRALPRKDRSAWVLDAVRERLRRERIEAIGRSAADHAAEELETLADWEPAKAPRHQRSRKKRR